MAPNPNPDTRASDADRDRAAASLQEHCAQGRITMDELHERLEAVYDARTVGRLEELTADLPEEDLYQLPVPASQPKSTETPVRRGDVRSRIAERPAAIAWRVWLVVSSLNFGIWLGISLAGGFVHPWWIWVAGPGLVVWLIMTIRDSWQE